VIREKTMLRGIRGERLRRRRLVWSKAFLVLLLAVVTEAYSDVSTQKKLVLVVSTFPNNVAREVSEALARKAGQTDVLEHLKFIDVRTLANETLAEKALLDIDLQQIHSTIFLDWQSLKMLRHRLSCPAIVLLRSRRMLETSKDADDSSLPMNRLAKGGLFVVETDPGADSFLKAIAELTPSPKTVGLVCTRNDVGNELFLSELEQVWKETFTDRMSLETLDVSGAACQNANALKNALEKRFDSLERGGILAVLPGQNTLKFPFVFRNFCDERNLGLAGLGSFPSSTTVLHITYPSEILAERCLGILAALARQERPTETEIDPRIIYDTKIGTALGYSFTSGNTSETQDTIEP